MIVAAQPANSVTLAPRVARFVLVTISHAVISRRKTISKAYISSSLERMASVEGREQAARDRAQREQPEHERGADVVHRQHGGAGRAFAGACDWPRKELRQPQQRVAGRARDQP